MIPGFRRTFFAAGLITCTLAWAVSAHAQQTPGTGANYETRLAALEEQHAP